MSGRLRTTAGYARTTRERRVRVTLLVRVGERWRRVRALVVTARRGAFRAEMTGVSRGAYRAVVQTLGRDGRERAKVRFVATPDGPARAS